MIRIKPQILKLINSFLTLDLLFNVLNCILLKFLTEDCGNKITTEVRFIQLS
jgi:hypothetical protein